MPDRDAPDDCRTIDLDRLVALAAAARALAGIDGARVKDLLDELLRILKAAEAGGAKVISIADERAKRR